MIPRRLGWFLALWSLAFACTHVAWALGWRGGMEPGMPAITDRPWFLAYDLLAAALMFAAAPVAVALGSGRASLLLRRLTVACSALALARGLPALVLDVADSTYDVVGFGADVWFTVAGACGFALLSATVPDHRAPRRAATALPG